MVLQHWHGQARGGSHLRLTNEAVQTSLDRCAFLSGEASLGRRVNTKQNLTQKFQASINHTKALDNALIVGTCIPGLQRFLAPRPVGYLKVSKKRFLVLAEDLPEELRVGMHDRYQRGAICDAIADETRLEVCWPFRPSLWQVLDMGSRGWYGEMFQIYAWGIRGSEQMDVLYLV